MKVLLNQVEVPKEIFIVNDGLNYGRFFDRKTVAYEIQLTNVEIMQLIEKEYNKVRDEIKLDDQLHNDTSDFRNTNYCSLPQLLQYESDFEEIMKTYLHITFLKKIFPESVKKEYVINSTDSIKMKNGMIVFKGKAFELAEI